MKRIISILAFATAFCAASSLASAQSFNTAYLLDNYSYNYRFNPSIAPDRNFFSIALGNLTLEEGCNVGIGHFLFTDPSGSGSLISGLNSAISSEQFIGSLPDNLYEHITFDMNLLAFGFYTKAGFFNFEVNNNVAETLSLPKAFFSFFKNGSSATAYDMSGTTIYGRDYLDFTLGWNKDITKRLAIGARAKFLLGGLNATMNANTLNVLSNSETLNVESDFQGSLAAPFVAEFSIDPFKLTVDPARIKPCGYGGAIDLGATYHITPELSVSLAVLDLGFISWNYTHRTWATGKTEFNGIENLDINSDLDINTHIQNLMNDLKALLDFKVEETSFTSTEMLDCTIDAGVKWRLPAYRRFAIGAMGSYTFNRHYSDYFDVRAGASILPLNWLCFTANAGYCSFGFTYGAALTINAAVLNIHAGVEGFAGQVTKTYYAPIDQNRLTVSLGLSITLCKSKNRYIPQNFDSWNWTSAADAATPPASEPTSVVSTMD